VGNGWIHEGIEAMKEELMRKGEGLSHGQPELLFWEPPLGALRRTSTSRRVENATLPEAFRDGREFCY